MPLGDAASAAFFNKPTGLFTLSNRGPEAHALRTKVEAIIRIKPINLFWILSPLFDYPLGIVAASFRNAWIPLSVSG